MIRADQINEAWERMVRERRPLPLRHRHRASRPDERGRSSRPRRFQGPHRAGRARRTHTTARTPIRDAFWLDQAKRLDWIESPTQAGDWSFDEADFHIRWYADGEAQPVGQLPRPPPRRAWRPDGDHLRGRRAGRRHARSPIASSTKRPAASPICSKQRGIGRGDRVMIYMPMIPEAAAAMLACARIGAIHSVVFGGFSPESVAGRIADCDACAVITADEGVRGGKVIPLKAQCRCGARAARRRRRSSSSPARAPTCR